MCGIAGVLTAGGEAARMTSSLGAMLTAVRHRGPDDEGRWSSPSGSAAFVHARLSILDLTTAGRQPMSIADGRFTITYNGEIYNFWELRRALEQRGVRFQTRTDTEVILRAYEADGPAFVAALRGMFAFAIWDEQERTCLIARDRFGIKPFYYYAGAERFVFASEVRALIRSGLVPKDLDATAVYGYFRTGSVPEPRTLLSNVCCLEAGHYAVWREGTLSPRRYWELRFSPDSSGSDHVASTRAALVDSVGNHFLSDAPVGVFLSGGIDSTALVALARTAGQRDLRTFSITFPGLPEDEGAIARRTAAHFGTRHDEWPIDGATGRELFGLFLRATDQPSIDGLNTFAVSKFARDLGVKVVLSGLGGDELFGGYPSFEAVPRLAAWSRRLSHASLLRTALRRPLQRVSRDPRWRRIVDLLEQPPTLAAAYGAFRGVFTRGESRSLAAAYSDQMVNGWTESGDGEQRDPTAKDTVSRLELSRYMRNQLLRDADAMSMAWGLELRVPFLDSVVLDTLVRIPAVVRLQSGKRLLIRAVPEIPEWVSSQPKRGFAFPVERWLAAEWSDVFAGLDRTSPVPLQTWYRKWCVFVLERWVKTMDDKVGA